MNVVFEVQPFFVFRSIGVCEFYKVERFVRVWQKLCAICICVQTKLLDCNSLFFFSLMMMMICVCYYIRIHSELVCALCMKNTESNLRTKIKVYVLVSNKLK